MYLFIQYKRIRINIYCLSVIFLILFFKLNFAESFDGLSFSDSYLDPGKVDIHYLSTKISNEYNFIWWSSIFKGGPGLVDYNLSENIKYNGGYFSPFYQKMVRVSLF